ncbi:hypothetical protein DRF75_03905 [Ehrlichia minasensis]|uniref:Uncharacterized protein n=1 Tax=Ehrlichia minasensis TaxID=1242993 RepID=A0A4Q6I715_9RICK|nr:hypothetical protein [Ehrlichia minasensis]RZB12476.1 hypothetical protein DRF75_03905 [Ehrlichia minasensis]
MDTVSIVLLVFLILILLLLILLAMAAVKCQDKCNLLEEGNKKLLEDCEQANKDKERLTSENNQLRQDNEKIKTECDGRTKALLSQVQKFVSDRLEDYKDFKESCLEMMELRNENVKNLFVDQSQTFTAKHVTHLFDTNMLFLQKGIEYEVQRTEKALRKGADQMFPSPNCADATVLPIYSSEQSHNAA